MSQLHQKYVNGVEENVNCNGYEIVSSSPSPPISDASVNLDCNPADRYKDEVMVLAQSLDSAWNMEAAKEKIVEQEEADGITERGTNGNDIWDEAAKEAILLRK